MCGTPVIHVGTSATPRPIVTVTRTHAATQPEKGGNDYQVFKPCRNKAWVTPLGTSQDLPR